MALVVNYLCNLINLSIRNTVRLIFSRLLPQFYNEFLVLERVVIVNPLCHVVLEYLKEKER
jgi:hypothetical protein